MTNTQSTEHQYSGIMPPPDLRDLVLGSELFNELIINDQGEQDIGRFTNLSDKDIERLAKDLVQFIEHYSTNEDLGDDTAWRQERERQKRSLFIIQNLLLSTRNALRASNTDGLTGLFNKKSFGEALEQKIAKLAKQQSLTVDQREGSTLEKGAALMYVDLEQFKPFNDIFDHQTGDAAIIAAADLLKSNARDTDITGRLGGDEYALLVSNVDEEGKDAVLKKYQDAFSKLYIEVDADKIIKLDEAKLAIIEKDSKDYKASDLTPEDYHKLGMRVKRDGDKLKLFIGASFGMAMIEPNMSASEVELAAERKMSQYKGDHRGVHAAFVPR